MEKAVISLKRLMIAAAGAVFLLFGGCAKNFQIVIPLEKSIPIDNKCSIGEITSAPDSLLYPSDKPSAEEIDLLKQELAEEIRREVIFAWTKPDYPEAEYEVIAKFIAFRRGEHTNLLFAKYGTKPAVIMELALHRKDSEDILFAGRFRGKVELGQKVRDLFDKVATDFARELKKQSKKIGHQ